MTPIVFTDLDDTLFQTARKMTETPRIDLLASRATNGSHSYMTPAQSAMFDWLNASTRLIPVTARSTGALSRCTLPFRDFRVASNGAVILQPDGKPDPEWQARTASISNTNTGFLQFLETFVAKGNTDKRLRHWIVTENGMQIYFHIKSNGDEAWLDEMQARLDEIVQGRLFLHRNGNNLAYMPAAISKKAAVDHLIRKIGPDEGFPIWGMGDSLTDLPFMESCQMMVIPTGSQAHKTFQER